jgi:predicted component of type VI protein secretion system
MTFEFEMDLPQEALYSLPGKSANNKTTQQAQGKQSNTASQETNWADLGLDLPGVEDSESHDDASASQKPYKNKTRMVSRVLRAVFSPKARNFTHTEGTGSC